MADYVTLADISAVAKQTGDFLKMGVIDTLRKESKIMDMLPFVPVQSLSAQGLRIKTLPDVQNRKVNATYSHKVGTVAKIEEAGFLFGGSVAIDRIYDKVSPTLVTGDYGAFQMDLFLKALAYQYNADFFLNTPAANADSIVGLWYRLNQDFSGQKIDAGAVDISPDGATLSVSFNKFFDHINALIYSLEEHTADALFMNNVTFLRFQAGLRQLGLLDTSTDSFGRTILRYGAGGPQLIDIGYKGDQSTRIITDVEAAGGALTGGTATSIYAAKFGQDYLTGWQLEEPQIIPFQKTALQREVTIDWYTGLFVTNPRSLARLYNIQAA